MSEICHFIEKIRKLQETNERVRGIIKHPRMFFEGLSNLNEMIGVEGFKAHIILTIQAMIVDAVMGRTMGHLRHMMILGAPGTGKSTLGMIICKIITGLGILEKPKVQQIKCGRNAQVSHVNSEELSKLINQDMARNLARVSQELEAAHRLNTQLRAQVFHERSIHENFYTEACYIMSQVEDEIREVAQFGISKKRNMNNHRAKDAIEDIILKAFKTRNRFKKAKGITLERRQLSMSESSKCSAEQKSATDGSNPEPNADLPLPTPTPTPTPTVASPPQMSQSVLPVTSIPDPKLQKQKIDEKEPELIFRTATRADLSGDILGAPGMLTRKFLESIFGGVGFIDEVYDLFNTSFSSGDAFGKEILGVIVDYMTRFPNAFVLIFGGYKKQTQESILTHQTGLASRINYTYIIEDYTRDQIISIFTGQLSKLGYKLKDDISHDMLSTIFIKEIENGRDTQQVCTHISNIQSGLIFEILVSGGEVSSEISIETLKQAVDMYIQSKHSSTPKKDEPPFGMYS